MVVGFLTGDSSCPIPEPFSGMGNREGLITVLYVDDESCLLDVAKIFLESGGIFRILTSESGSCALDLLKKTRVDAIVSDYQMPGMDGIELLRQVRSAYSDIPFILFTGKGREEVAIDAINNGADSYIQKGGSTKAQFADLAHKITVLVERNRTRINLKITERKYKALFESASVAIMIARIDGETVYIDEVNSLALSFFGLAGSSPDTIYPRDFLSNFRPGMNSPTTTFDEYIKEAIKGEPGSQQWNYRSLRGTEIPVEVMCRHIDDGNRGSIVMISVRDVTETVQATGSLTLANRKLALLSAITRHDIRNRLMILEAYLYLAESDATNTRVPGYIGKMLEITRGIRKQIDFTKEYQDFGNGAPAWQELHEVIKNATMRFDTDEIKIEIGFDAVEIFADRMLENVFYNLIQNAVFHGGPCKTITFTVDHESAEGCTIIVQDDGKGIAQEDKERIFEQGFGRKNGLGLYLIREILDITGIRIHETGRPGEGARFEILVPAQAFRIGSKVPPNNPAHKGECLDNLP